MAKVSNPVCPKGSKQSGLSKSPFLRLCVVGIRSTKILLGDGVPTDKTAFTEKLV